jgi:hypothetical protein
MFLSGSGFPERGTGRPRAVALAGLTFSVSRLSRRHFQAGLHAIPLFNTVLPFIADYLPDYSGRAAILSRERPGAFPAPSHGPRISSVTYSSALPRKRTK